MSVTPAGPHPDVPPTASRRAAVAWAFYDWANSAFAVTVMSAFFPLLLSKYWTVNTDPAVVTFQLGTANAIASVVIALAAPILGAIADRGGQKKRWLVGFALLGIATTAALPFAGRGEWPMAIGLYVLATVGFSASSQFYDALLVDVSARSRYHQVSGLGFGLGYLGGGLLFAIDVAMTLRPETFGLRDATQAALVAFGTVAVWWALFSIPLMMIVREPHGVAALPARATIVASFREVLGTLRAIRGQRSIRVFLIAYWLYIDAVGTVATMALNYGLGLGLDETSLIGALLITQFVGFPAAIGFGYLGARIGPKLGIGIGLAVYVVALVWGSFMQTAGEFYVLAAVVGLVQGGVQSLSRSLFARLVPQDHAAEFFGFYNVVGKFAAIIGPMLMGSAAVLTGSPRAGVVAIAALFAVGGVMLARVKDKSAQAVAQA
ncbi:MAG: MFS transporter [Casimicrobiaceae bacterium]